MPRKRRRSKARRSDLPLGAVHYLLHGEHAELATDDLAELLVAFRTDCLLPTVWDELRADLVADWVSRHPGTRPWAWWRFDAPRDPATNPLPRRHLGGSGVPASRRLAYTATTEFGVLRSWLDVDPSDPPVFESEAEYLNRHELLGEDERERLPEDALRPLVLDVSAVPRDWLDDVLHLRPQDAREGRVVPSRTGFPQPEHKRDQ